MVDEVGTSRATINATPGPPSAFAEGWMPRGNGAETVSAVRGASIVKSAKHRNPLWPSGDYPLTLSHKVVTI
jgi:hypothetical protein